MWSGQKENFTIYLKSAPIVTLSQENAKQTELWNLNQFDLSLGGYNLVYVI